MLRPPLPHVFEELGPMLLNYEFTRQIYQDNLVCEAGSIACIVGHNDILQRLGQVNEWHVDGTFQCVPQRPRAAQLLIIKLRRMDVGIPALYILCSRRTIHKCTQQY